MKSITKKLSLLFALSAVLFLTSCLDSGDNHYIGDNEYSYIVLDETSGTVYARTLGGYFITSEKINSLSPGTTAFITYQITDETETITLDNKLTVYKATLGAEPTLIDQSRILMGEAPEDATMKFESLLEPIYSQYEYFGDRWLFPYTYKAKKGETIKVSFYKSDVTDTEATSNDDIIIDVRLTKTGTPEAGAETKLMGNYVAANFSDLRSILTHDESIGEGKVNLKFRFYRNDTEDLYTSTRTYQIHIEK